MNREQCRGCVFFNSADGEPGAIKFCNYMLRTGERRKVGENEKCLSRKQKSFRMRGSFTLKKKKTG